MVARISFWLVICSSCPVLCVLYAGMISHQVLTGGKINHELVIGACVCLHVVPGLLLIPVQCKAALLQLRAQTGSPLFIHNHPKQLQFLWPKHQRKFVRAGDKNIFGRQPETVWAWARWFFSIAKLPYLPAPSLSAQRWGTAAHKQTEKVKRTWRWK